MWEAIDGPTLDPWEQSLIIKQMAGALNERRPPVRHRLNADKVIEAARSFTDE